MGVRRSTGTVGGLGSGVSLGDTDWHLIGDTGEPAFQNSWVNYDTIQWSDAAFRIDGQGFVHLTGFIKSGTVADDSTGLVFTLPIGHRPDISNSMTTMMFIVIAAVVELGRVDVDGDGSVLVRNPTSNIWVSLDGITFKGDTT